METPHIKSVGKQFIVMISQQAVVGDFEGQRNAPAGHCDFEGSQHAVGVWEGHGNPVVPPHCVPFWAKDADNATRRLRR